MLVLRLKTLVVFYLTEFAKNNIFQTVQFRHPHYKLQEESDAIVNVY